ncbi:hypothetical protein [Glycomyces sp. YM15]|uniref:hypothetical protein n=1 Tax=Glycomyces sp. YM15 TaxID=2800446 RepID=UPI001966C4B3|nr:hypothetical protein [Glycomyces sp. YM15]
MRRRTLFTAGAASLAAGTATVGTLPAWAQTWTYHQGSNGASAVYSFLANSQRTETSIDNTGHCRWLVAQGHMPEVRIDQIQFGWEITSAAGGHDFTVDDYSLTVRSGPAAVRTRASPSAREGGDFTVHGRYGL